MNYFFPVSLSVKIRGWNESCYDQENDNYDVIDGFAQVRGEFSQENVNVKVNDRVQVVNGSHGKSCLCASLMFVASTLIKRNERICGKYLDTILMRGNY